MIKHHYYCTNAATTATISLRRTGGKSSSSSSTSESCCCVSTVWMCLFLDLRLLHHQHQHHLPPSQQADNSDQLRQATVRWSLIYCRTALNDNIFFLRMMHLLCRAAIDGAIDGSYKSKIKCQRSNITGRQKWGDIFWTKKHFCLSSV